MNELMTFEGKTVEVFEFEGKTLFNPKDIGSCLSLKYKTVANHMSEMQEDEVIKLKNSNFNQIKFRKIHNTGENFLTEQGVASLIQRCDRKTVNEKFYIISKFQESGYLSNYNVINSRKEIEFLYLLEGFLSCFGIFGVRQYTPIDTLYRIDFYIENLNLAIEYDENNHSHYNFEEDFLREETIKDKLKCEFIRISDSQSHIANIGIITKKMVEKGYI